MTGAFSIILSALLGFAGMTIGSFVTWKIAKRTTSGQVGTTEAAKLWEEGGSIRQDLMAEVVRLQTQVTEQQRQLTHVTKQYLDAYEEIVHLKIRLDEIQR